MRCFAATTVALTLLLVPLAASAQLYGEASESPRSHSVGIKFGPYTPNIDSEGNKAYDWAFDGDPMFTFRLEYEYQFWTQFGSLAVGAEWGYASITGKGLAHDSHTTTADETSLHMFPFALSFIYNFDVLAVRYNVPLVPYVRLGFDYNIWWITDGVGDTASYRQGETASTAFGGSGGTFGWHAQVGLKLLLDVFAPNMAKTFDNEVGVNNSYFFAEMLYADISDFGSDTSWDIGTLTALFGLSFEF